MYYLKHFAVAASLATNALVANSSPVARPQDSVADEETDGTAGNISGPREGLASIVVGSATRSALTPITQGLPSPTATPGSIPDPSGGTGAETPDTPATIAQIAISNDGMPVLDSATGLTDSLEAWILDDGLPAVASEIMSLCADGGLSTAAQDSLTASLNTITTNPDVTLVSAVASNVSADIASAAVARRDNKPVSRDIHFIDYPELEHDPLHHRRGFSTIAKSFICGGTINGGQGLGRKYTAAFISATVTTACNLWASGTTVGRKSYPHFFGDGEGLFEETNKLQIYPIVNNHKVPGTVWKDQFGPGLDRVVIENNNGICQFVGLITHGGATTALQLRNSFRLCS